MVKTSPTIYKDKDSSVTRQTMVHHVKTKIRQQADEETTQLPTIYHQEFRILHMHLHTNTHIQQINRCCKKINYVIVEPQRSVFVEEHN